MEITTAQRIHVLDDADELTIAHLTMKFSNNTTIELVDRHHKVHAMLDGLRLVYGDSYAMTISQGAERRSVRHIIDRLRIEEAMLIEVLTSRS